MRFSLTKQFRSAITLVEVMFAIGVVLIGLLGLLSVMPLAGRRAQDSISLSMGSALSESVLTDLQSRRYLNNGQLGQVPSIRPIAALTKLTVPTMTTPTMLPFCIDPMFASFDADANSRTLSTNGYDPTLFPFYKVNHDPLLDPSSSNSTVWPFPQPRMLRVGVTRLKLFNAMLNIEEALMLTENQDDLPVFRPKDRSLNSTYQSMESVSSGLDYGKRVPTGDFSWIATVNPLPGNVYATVSIVVIRDRERTFEVPTTVAATPRENAESERLAYVSYAQGFSGGSGGTVHLVGAGNTISRLRTDDWVLLSRRSPAPNLVSQHRWYRVASADIDAEEAVPTSNTSLNGTVPLPDPSPANRNSEVWLRRVVLDGPDFTFGFTGSADGAVVDNTFATIVPNVVSVTERVMLLSDL
ncbi:hypothetical protein [Novipirellula artificiosorum]|uniref:Uncharacterized protein n=1 Tax=Novipirellula artificiosorum TaxID=2528016 RepID=A0A5C6D9Z6_9BACT|nr:hypothetical protein [Novipirellula artificiosorum]TWU33752.1 hypothetical protein Poly41_47490 [Novipirellula artificiosorum]